MKVVVIYLDDDGIECYREEMDETKAKRLYGDIVEKMKRTGKWYGMVGDKIIMLKR